METLEQRVMLDGVEYLPGLVGPEDFLEHCAGQAFYLDFDGAESISFNGPLTVEGIDVPAFSLQATPWSGRAREGVQSITQYVSNVFAPFNVQITSMRPNLPEYSTVYIGGTGEAFSAYGDFFGLAEQVDIGNTIRNDEAFVFADRILMTGNGTDLVNTIVHEIGHLLGLSHSQARTLHV